VCVDVRKYKIQSFASRRSRSSVIELLELNNGFIEYDRKEGQESPRDLVIVDELDLEV